MVQLYFFHWYKPFIVFFHNSLNQHVKIELSIANLKISRPSKFLLMCFFHPWYFKLHSIILAQKRSHDSQLQKVYYIPANFFWDISVRFLSWECWDFWRRHDHFRRIPKKSSADVRSLPKSAEGELAPSAFHFKNQRSRGRYCHLFILHIVFVPYMGLS